MQLPLNLENFQFAYVQFKPVTAKIGFGSTIELNITDNTKCDINISGFSVYKNTDQFFLVGICIIFHKLIIFIDDIQVFEIFTPAVISNIYSDVIMANVDGFMETMQIQLDSDKLQPPLSNIKVSDINPEVVNLNFFERAYYNISFLMSFDLRKGDTFPIMALGLVDYMVLKSDKIYIEGVEVGSNITPKRQTLVSLSYLAGKIQIVIKETTTTYTPKYPRYSGNIIFGPQFSTKIDNSETNYNVMTIDDLTFF